MRLLFSFALALALSTSAQTFNLYRSTDGAQWTETTGYFKTNRINVLLSDQSGLLAGTDNGLFLSTDNCENWKSQGTLGNVQGITRIKETLVVGTKRGIWIG